MTMVPLVKWSFMELTQTKLALQSQDCQCVLRVQRRVQQDAIRL